MKKINITMSQTVTGTSNRAQTNGMQSGNLKDNSSFGSVFSRVMSGLPVAPKVAQETTESSTDSELLAILNAKTLEELTTALNATSEGLEDNEKIDDLLKMIDFESLEVNPQSLMDSIIPLLDAIDALTPQFFNNLLASLEGNGEMPKDQAIELLAFLKTIEVSALKTDLYVKQEQQVFNLQSMLTTVANEFETNLNVKSLAKIELAQLPQQVVRFVVQSDVNQDSNNNDSNPKETTKDTQLQSMGAASSHMSIFKSDLSATEVENRNNARNETLMKELQNILKRSNFGQAGGTNRLLVKLNPEHLGQVRIELIQINGIMTARILASTALGKEMLDSQLHQLKASFQQQNLQVDRIDVSQTLQDTTRNGRDQAFNQHFKQDQETAEQQQSQNPEDEMTFQEYMIELEA
ncbi:flagellar hook-length control protein FliK [Sporosarcina siberiensis]|uniref:Flagellar hook-length control protein FliK n=1 Tax=Sporosarcina siberiensis TaxID=1365606 RepID=A0ABW4SGX1_9BACL